MDHPKDIRLSHTLRPGDMGALVSLHGRLYAKEQGFDVFGNLKAPQFGVQ